jgi:putative membrane protein
MNDLHMHNPGLVFSILHWVVSAFALMITAYIVPGFKVKSFGSALITAVVIGLANVVIWPILFFLTFPINILTLGLFTFVVNGMVLKICAALLPGFVVDSWFAAIIGAIFLSIISTGLHYFLI